jgi:hypothetical protein
MKRARLPEWVIHDPVEPAANLAMSAPPKAEEH